MVNAGTDTLPPEYLFVIVISRLFLYHLICEGVPTTFTFNVMDSVSFGLYNVFPALTISTAAITNTIY